jgi:hypothetical protein
MEGLQMRKLTSLLIVTVAFGLATPAGAQTRAHSATTRPGNTPPSANIRGSSGALQKMSPQSIPTNEMQGLPGDFNANTDGPSLTPRVQSNPIE